MREVGPSPRRGWLPSSIVDGLVSWLRHGEAIHSPCRKHSHLGWLLGAPLCIAQGKGGSWAWPTGRHACVVDTYCCAADKHT